MSTDSTMEVDLNLTINESEIEPMSDPFNSSIDHVTSADESFDKSLMSSTKKIKLSQEERDRLRVEKEKLRKEREMMKMQREMTKLEREKARIEREKLRVAREKQLIEERERRENDKQMKLRMKEEEKEKREKLKKEKEEERIRLKEAKEKERKRRLEEKQAIAEEAKKKEIQAKLENEMKLEKSRAVLFNFLKKSNNNDGSNSDDSFIQNNKSNDENCLNSFVPNNLLSSFDPKKFDNSIVNQNEELGNLYLCNLQNGKIKPYSKPINDNDYDIEVLDDELPERYRNTKFIFLQFHENVKPPYFGPQSQSLLIDGRNPFFKIDTLDYDLDSDEEWEEGGPGESLSSSDSEPEEKDDYEIDNDFFVPHGYLSDDEELTHSNDADPDNCKKNGPLYKEQTLLAERSRRFNDRLQPECIGCIWSSSFSEKFEFLEQFKIIVMPK